MNNDTAIITSSHTGDGHLTVLLEGQLIIRNGNTIKKELTDALNRSQNVTLVFRNIIKIDLAVLQLLIALQKSAATLEKNLSFDIELPEHFRTVIKNSGLDGIFLFNFKSQVNKYNNTVLIVDDSNMVMKLLSFIIKKAGYTVLSAVDGNNALELLDEGDIDLVITDLNMPNKDGVELIREIRLTEHYRYVPVILFISGSEEEKTNYMKTSGATMLFDKNDIKEKMIPTIKKMIG